MPHDSQAAAERFAEALAAPDEERVLPAQLTLDESGWLCHAVAQQILDVRRQLAAAVKRKARSRGKTDDLGFLEDPDHLRRQLFWLMRLHHKLAAVNDKLMGKIPSELRSSS